MHDLGVLGRVHAERAAGPAERLGGQRLGERVRWHLVGAAVANLDFAGLDTLADEVKLDVDVLGRPILRMW